MTRWFRFYDDTIHDPKILKLSDKSFRIWVGLLCLASKNSGTLPSFDDIAIMLRIKPDKLQPELETLVEAGLIDHDDTGMHPHNWKGRQYKSDVSTPRVKRFRNSKRNVSETPPDTDTDTDTEKKKDAAPDGAQRSGQERDLFARGKEILGPNSGGMIAKLLMAKGRSVAESRAAIEIASTKQNAREYVGRIIAGAAEDAPERGIIDARRTGIV
jgi:hypothetical protein